MGLEPRLFSDYRSAFTEFAQRARQARALMSAANPDWQAIDAALLELEKARVNYNHRRDVLAQELFESRKTERGTISSSSPLVAAAPFALLSFSVRPTSDTIQPQASRVREIAQLRWELAGKPEGTDDENWYRAEDIVRRATAA